MSLPIYTDLGKQAEDVFGKGYYIGIFNLKCKSKPKEGVEITTAGKHTFKSGNASGNLEAKYVVKNQGLSFTGKWTTDNIFNTEVALQDKIAKGVKIAVNIPVNQTGKQHGLLKTSYKGDALTVNLDSTLDPGGPVINGATVASYRNWIVGYQMSFKTYKPKCNYNNFAFGYKSSNFTVHTFANNFEEVGGSLYHKVNPDLEGAVDLSWSAGSKTPKFSIGCKYALDKEANVRAKVNNSSQIGFGYEQKVRDGITLTLSTLIDGKNFNQGGHKVGIGLEFQD